MWDTAAKTMAVNVIAKVEGGGAWDAINYNDPITIGLMQWFGTRAAGLLKDIETDHPTEYATIASSLRDAVATYPPDNLYWRVRYLNKSEGDSLKPVLRASKDTQGALVASDVDDYKEVCDRIGLNVDTNTNTAILFMVAYHQTPQRAIGIMKLIGMGSSIERLYAAIANNVVFGQYASRYREARDLIVSGVPPEIIDLNNEGEEAGDDGGLNDIEFSDEPPKSDFDAVRDGISRIEIVGSQLVIHLADTTKTFAYNTGGNNFMVSETFTGEAVPDATPEPDESDPTPSPDPDPPTGNEVTDKQNAIVKFMTDRIGRYGYSQGASRLTPEKNMVTDCSGLTRFAYLSVTGKDIGTYTDAQVTSKQTYTIQKGGGGNSPNESLMEKGDLVITARYGTASNRIASHVEIYMGGGQIIGHGGVPYMGPVTKSLADRTADKKTWWVKRLNGW